MIDGSKWDHARDEGRVSLEGLPEEYGPHKTVYNRFARWSEKGVWHKIFEAVAGSSAAPHQVALDSSQSKSIDVLLAKRGPAAQAIGNTKGGRKKYQDSCGSR
jgi:transposase